MAKSKKKPFKDWQAEEVEKTFGIEKKRTLPFLECLKSIALPEDHPNRALLEKYRLELFDYIDSWNEDEYKFMFISPYFKLIDFTTPYFKVFTQRPLSVAYNNNTEITAGNVEFMPARGRQIPDKPHFFFCTSTSPKKIATMTLWGNY